MKRATSGYLLVLVCFSVVVMSWASDASAQAASVSLSGTFIGWCAPPGGPCPPPEDSLADGILFRRADITFWFPPDLGDLEGVAYLTVSNFWNVSTLEGRGHGSNVLEACYGGLCGVFEGHNWSDISPSETGLAPPGFPPTAISADSVYTGSGDFEGMTMSLHSECDWDFVEPFPFPFQVLTFVCHYTGTILDSKGNL